MADQGGRHFKPKNEAAAGPFSRSASGPVSVPRGASQPNVPRRASGQANVPAHAARRGVAGSGVSRPGISQQPAVMPTGTSQANPYVRNGRAQSSGHTIGQPSSYGSNRQAQVVPAQPSPYQQKPRGGSQRSGQTQGVRGGNGPGKKDAERAPRKRNVLSYVLIAIGVVLLLVAGGLFVRAQIGYKQAADFYNGLTEQAVSDSDSKGVPNVDFEALKQTSDDIVGWIYVPGTQINYVVAQGETNNTYLRHLPNGEYNENGTIFMDVDNTAPGLVDQQTTLYGHHMNDGSMFKFIDDTTQQDVFDTVEEVYYITDGTTYVLKPLFTMVVQDDYTDARVPNFESEEAFRQYLQTSLASAKASASDAAERIDEVKQVLTLVTCAGEIIPRTTRAGMVCELVDSYAN